MKFITLSFFTFLTFFACAETAQVKTEENFSQKKYFKQNGIAIKGYDPVAYFDLEKQGLTQAQIGKEQWSYEWEGAEWRFSSEENKKLFIANPTKYAPQYGGWCAYGVSRNYLVGIDPQAWSIVDDKLYLNYSLSVRRTWLKKTKHYIDTANINFPKLL